MWVKIAVTLSAGLIVLIMAGFALLEGQASAQNPTLYWGSTGNDVSRVQQRLSQWGYYSGIVDGVFGGSTSQAVSRFQRSNGLNADGIVGKTTWDALGLSAPDNVPAVSRGAATGRGELTLLAQVIEGEAADEPLTGKVAVGAVILNRTKSASFPRTISGVIYQPDAFESINNGQAYRPLTQESIQAAGMAMNGYDPSGGALFFWNPSKSVSPWVWSRSIVTQIGNHVFAR
ncbi:MAG: Spore cortex-lytic enzyme precursor [Pelotomaculum sp. PtaB.Bin104]|nr:MAG: Spore cortex-lytic enzyme precursor [Pelotomaculum sp. PtaB.Bin104]